MLSDIAPGKGAVSWRARVSAFCRGGRGGVGSIKNHKGQCLDAALDNGLTAGWSRCAPANCSGDWPTQHRPERRDGGANGSQDCIKIHLLQATPRTTRALPRSADVRRVSRSDGSVPDAAGLADAGVAVVAWLMGCNMGGRRLARFSYTRVTAFLAARPEPVSVVSRCAIRRLAHPSP
jgi:hypothetical protein